MTHALVPTLFILFFACQSYSQPPLQITEVMARNIRGIKDDAGITSDWIEVHNSATEAINIEGYSLSDTPGDPIQWILPYRELAPDEHLIIFASGADRRDTEHWHTNFQLSSKSEVLTLTTKYGEMVQRIPLENELPDISYGTTPEGRWARFDLPSPGEPNPSTIWLEKTRPTIEFTELFVGGAAAVLDEDGIAHDWIEIHNYGTKAVQLSAFRLTDDPGNPDKWRFPSYTLEPNEYLLLFASGTDKKGIKYHTNFKLSRKDTLQLASPNGQVLDQIDLSKAQHGFSLGKQGDSWFLFSTPTPETENNTQALQEARESTFPIRINEVMASDMSGPYRDWIELYNTGDTSVPLEDYGFSDDPDMPHKWQFPAISIPPKGFLLVPCLGSKALPNQLQAPFRIDSLGEEIILSDPHANTLARFHTGYLPAGISSGFGPNNQRRYFDTPSPNQTNGMGLEGWIQAPKLPNDGYYPDGLSFTLTQSPEVALHYTTDGQDPTLSSPLLTAPVEINETTHIRVQAFSDNHLSGPVQQALYLVRESHNLPVMSVSVDQYDFLDPVDGLYSMGENAQSYFPYKGANFWSREELPAHMTYLTKNGKIASQASVGLKIFGGWSRGMRKKPLRLISRDRYGDSQIRYPFFEELPQYEFSELVIRQSGQDAPFSSFRDAMIHQLIQDLPVESQACTPAILYVNGDYWGIYYIREKISPDFISRHSGFLPDDIDLLEGAGRQIAGSAQSFYELEKWLSHANPRSQNFADELAQFIDINNFIDHTLIQVFLANTDVGNVRFWKAPKTQWRWVLYDMDLSMKISDDDTIKRLLNPPRDNLYPSKVLKAVLKNETLREKFLDRSTIFAHDVFTTERMLYELNKFQTLLEPELKDDRLRWDYPYPMWETAIEDIQKFIRNRQHHLFSHYQKHFSLSREELRFMFPEARR